MMIYDANGFIGKWPYWPIEASSPADVMQKMDRLKIDRAAICSTRSVFVNWEDGNVEAERAATEHPDRFTAFACLGTTELSHMLREAARATDYVTRNFRGVRLYPQHHSYHPVYEGFLGPLLEEIAGIGWPVLLPLRIIMNWGMPALELPVMETLVARHPKVNWILSGINYLFELQMAISLMRQYSTVHLETSCVMGYTAVSKLVQQSGSEQILFGSGTPLQNGAAGLTKILQAHIPEKDREAILGGNLRRLLKEG